MHLRPVSAIPVRAAPRHRTLLAAALAAAAAFAGPLGAQAGATFVGVAVSRPAILSPEHLANGMDGRIGLEAELRHALPGGVELGVAYRRMRFVPNTGRGESTLQSLTPTIGFTASEELPVRPYVQLGAGLVIVTDRSPPFDRTVRSHGMGFDGSAGLEIPFGPGVALRLGANGLFHLGSFSEPNAQTFAGAKAGLHIRL